jgi:hypothetical protein
MEPIKPVAAEPIRVPVGRVTIFCWAFGEIIEKK